MHPNRYGLVAKTVDKHGPSSLLSGRPFDQAAFLIGTSYSNCVAVFHHVSKADISRMSYTLRDIY